MYDEADYDGCGSAPCPATATIIDGALTNGTGVVAIATDNGGLEGGSTSEFSMNPISLPVEMASFEAVQDAGTVRLTWATASEANNAGFHVQHRRADAAAKGATTPPWTSAGFVPGHGTTTEARSYMHRVEGLAPGRYQFRLKQVDHDGATGYSPEVEVTVGVVGEVLLSDAYPNPFNPQTQFTLAVAHAQPVRIAVYDALGREVAVLHEGPMAANRTETVTWRAGAVPSGVYFVRAVGERFVQTRRVMLVK